jgi:hypothetical protein
MTAGRFRLGINSRPSGLAMYWWKRFGELADAQGRRFKSGRPDQGSGWGCWRLRIARSRRIEE